MPTAIGALSPSVQRCADSHRCIRSRGGGRRRPRDTSRGHRAQARAFSKLTFSKCSKTVCGASGKILTVIGGSGKVRRRCGAHLSWSLVVWRHSWRCVYSSRRSRRLGAPSASADALFETERAGSRERRSAVGVCCAACAVPHRRAVRRRSMRATTLRCTRAIGRPHGFRQDRLRAKGPLLGREAGGAQRVSPQRPRRAPILRSLAPALSNSPTAGGARTLVPAAIASGSQSLFVELC
ncbi:unnamed protein product, partial [Iphiclides podalirius]